MKLYKYKNGKCNVSGNNIRCLREKADLSQEQLAARIQLAGLNLNQKAISRIETGERVVPDFELLFFSSALNVSVLTLLKTD
ncbi:MAG TPA: helix-turn-helix domain-containing protein [Candidatus Mediterraneibacter merdipullorum]|nr:helix-turn-helix domain-containing protein [Candidatus Mediterraneibacter merdipullorum]